MFPEVSGLGPGVASLGAPLLAAFMFPGLFAAGAAAAAAPILIHLLARRRFRQVRWAAIEFILQAERRNRRRVRLEELLLLLLRCLALLLVGLVVSRPFVQPGGWAGMIGGGGRVDRVFLLDDSLSMGYRELASDGGWGQSRFDRAKNDLLQLLAWVRRASPESTVSVLLSSAPDRPLTVGAYLDEAAIADLGERIEALSPSERTFDVAACADAVRKLLESRPETLNAVLTVVSDFQRNDWIGPKPPEGGSSNDTKGVANPLAALVEWTDARDDGQSSLRVLLLAEGGGPFVNRAVAALEPLQSRYVAGIDADIRARITNFGDEDAPAQEMQVSQGSVRLRAEAIPPIAAGEQVGVVFAAHPQVSGYDIIGVELPADGLVGDDSRTMALPVDAAMRVLLVNGEPAGDAYEDEVRLLAAALAPSGQVFSGNQVEAANESSLESLEVEGPHVVVMANVHRLSAPAVERLEAFVRAGGGLLVFLGDQVDAEWYNEALYRGGAGLLPAKLGSVHREEGAGVALVVEDPQHPMMGVFAGLNNVFQERVRFQAYFDALMDDGAEDDSPDDADVEPDFGGGRVVARLSDGEGTPLIVERPWGVGRVVLVTTTCDLEWNDWARDASYVVSMLEGCRALARGADDMQPAFPGEPIELLIDPAKYNPDIVVRMPGYPDVREASITAAPDEVASAKLRITWEQTDQTGAYRFVLGKVDGGESERVVAVNVDPAESDLAAATEQMLRSAIPGVEVEYTESVDALERADEGARRELWPAFLIAAVLTLLAEQSLAFWFGRRA